MVGHLGTAPSLLLVPSQAGSLSPSCPMKMADGGGHSPQTISGSTCFQDKVPQRSASPSIKWLSRRESHSRPLPSQGSALVLLSYGIMVEDYGISPYSNRVQAGRVVFCH